ncbi:MAG: hypothetical protein ACI9WO_002245 [Sphingobacteriales bacterium]
MDNSRLELKSYPVVFGIILKSSFVSEGRRGEVAKATLKMKNGIEELNDFRKISFKKPLVSRAWVARLGLLLDDKLLFKIKP